jgi:hypothetical protein
MNINKPQHCIIRLIACIAVLFYTTTTNAYTIRDEWNDPGVTVTDPNAWEHPGVIVTTPNDSDSFSSHDTPSCAITTQCDANGNCVQHQICD